MFEKISVIIPVYNTETYLRKCLDSVCRQTYENLEIICVDDGSTDSSGDILENYARGDSRIKVIHKVNGGESSARNVGLRNSTGKYVAFVDGDDWLESRMYENMIRVMKDKKLDMAACNYYWDTDYESVAAKNEATVSKEVFGRKELFQYVYMRERYRGVTSWIWCKLFKRELLYEKGKMLEFHEDLQFGADLLFFIKAAANANRIYYLENAFYHYYQRADSTAHSNDLRIIFDIVTAYQRMIDFLLDTGIEPQIIPWLQKFQGYWALLVAEKALQQKDKFMLQECQGIMKKLEIIYVEMNKEYPERLIRYRKCMNEDF